MLDTILRWLGAGDSAIAAMGPVLSIALALLGGYGVTQLLKFPLAQLVTDQWRAWSIRAIAAPATFLFAHYLGDLPLGLELVVAVCQPIAYTVAMAVVRHFWPWLEAGFVAGSVAPSAAAVRAKWERG